MILSAFISIYAVSNFTIFNIAILFVIFGYFTSLFDKYNQIKTTYMINIESDIDTESDASITEYDTDSDASTTEEYDYEPYVGPVCREIDSGAEILI